MSVRAAICPQEGRQRTLYATPKAALPEYRSGQIGPTNLVHRNYIREVGKIEQNCVRFEQFQFPFNGHAAVDNASDPSVDAGLFSVILL